MRNELLGIRGSRVLSEKRFRKLSLIGRPFKVHLWFSVPLSPCSDQSLTRQVESSLD